MKFYESVSDYYDYIFPENLIKSDFVDSGMPKAQNLHLLDIGCATGGTSAELAKRGYQLTGIDLDEKMLQTARKKVSGMNIEAVFFCEDMMKIQQRFQPGSFHGILCLGNTLVHLTNYNDILNFLKQVNRLLAQGGKFFLQIINYNRIIEKQINALPTIDNEQIRFVRNYNFQKNQKVFTFETELLVKASGKIIKNSVPLYALQKEQLETALRKAGFSNVSFFGSFKRNKLLPESIPLVVEAS